MREKIVGRKHVRESWGEGEKGEGRMREVKEERRRVRGKGGRESVNE